MRSAYRTRLILHALENRTVPTTFVVTNTTDAVVPPAGSLRKAVADANANLGADTITFTVPSGSSIALTAGELSITEAVTVTGLGAANLFIDGTASSRVFNTSGAPTGAAVNISGLTVVNGKSALAGGGIAVGDEALTLTACVVTGNTATFDGGGIYVQSIYGALALSGCTVSNNTVTGAGNDGGGINLQGASAVTIQESTIAGNLAPDSGGGIYFNNGGTLFMERSTLSGNKATGGTGGGLYFFGVAGASGLAVRSSTFSGNDAGSSGGGIVLNNFTGTLTVQNSTITSNNSGGGSGGGGISQTGGLGTISLESTVVWNNTSVPPAPDIFAPAATPVSANFCAIGSSSGFSLSGSSANNLPFALPLSLGPLQFNGGGTQTHAPFDFSPVVNKGSNPASLGTDQRGTAFARSVGGGVDIGAVEVQHAFVVTNDNNIGAGSLRQALVNANANPGPDTVTFDPGFFSSAKTILLPTGEIPITDAVTVTGPGAALATVNATLAGRVFNISLAVSAPVTLSGLTITGGNAGAGGAINCVNAALTLSNCVIFGNFASGSGGAVKVASSSLSIESCTIANNVSTANGGGVWFFGFGASVLVENSTISGNSAGGGGGGGLFADMDGTLTVHSTTISGNTSAPAGGGIRLNNFSGTLNILNSTITDNSTGSSGGGIVANSAIGSASVLSSVIAGNTDSGGVAPDIQTNLTVDVTYSAIGSPAGFKMSGHDNLGYGFNLNLGPLVSNGGPTLTHVPGPGSPLIDRGSNPLGLLFDQRGLPRLGGAVTDIGAVEVVSTQVNGITRTGASPTAAASVGWAVNFADAIFGLTASNVSLSGPGAAGASITGITGSGKNWTVTANTGGEGLLGLNMVNATGLSHLISNLPFVGESYAVDKLPLSVSVTATPTAINDFNTGASALTLKASYSEPMNTAVNPAFSFPVENPFPSVSFASGSWTGPATYEARYNVFDLNSNIPDIDVRVTGGQDQADNTFGIKTVADLIDIDTQNPIVLAMSRDNPSPTNLATVGWTVTFSESVTGVAAGNFTLFNGGLGGSPAISSVTGGGTTWTVTASTGTGQGTLSLYVVSATGVTDAAGNPLAGLPVNGPAYAIDHVSPQAAKVTTNTLLINDATVGPAGFQVTIQFNELMNQAVNPTVSFPVENPAPTLAFASGVWLDAKTYRATYAVADLGVDLPDVDIHISGAQDAVGNVQAPLTITDLLDVDTKNPVVSKVLINEGAAQRSRVTSVKIDFDQVVTLPGTPETAFQLKRQSDNALVGLSAAVFNDTATHVTLTFTGPTTDFGSLQDGRYTLTVFAASVADQSGNAFDSNGDSTGGDDYVLASAAAPNPPTNIFRLFGDNDGDGDNDGVDFLAFRTTSGLSNGEPGFNPNFDFDNDGDVDAQDFLQYRSRFGSAV